MGSDYFGRSDVVAAMDNDHRAIWLEFLLAVRPLLQPGCRVMDFGCSSGGLLRLLFTGEPGTLAPVDPALAIGLDLPSRSDVLSLAAQTTPASMRILFSHASPDSFPAQFDVVLSHEVVYLIEDLVATFAGIRASLREGGVFAAATMGFLEHPYYRRWVPRFRDRGIRTFAHSRRGYVEALQAAGFDSVEEVAIAISPERYAAWRSEHPFDDYEWFESEPDERRYFTELGKIAFVART